LRTPVKDRLNEMTGVVVIDIGPADTTIGIEIDDDEGPDLGLDLDQETDIQDGIPDEIEAGPDLGPEIDPDETDIK